MARGYLVLRWMSESGLKAGSLKPGVCTGFPVSNPRLHAPYFKLLKKKRRVSRNKPLIATKTMSHEKTAIGRPSAAAGGNER